MTRGSPRVIALAAIAAIVVVACGAALATGSVRLGSDTRLRLPTHEQGDSQPLGVASGQLALQDGCVYLGSASIPDQYLVIWPVGYYESDGAVRDSSGQSVAQLNETVSLMGAEGPAVGDKWLEEHVLSPNWMPTCRARAYWLASGVADR